MMEKTKKELAAELAANIIKHSKEAGIPLQKKKLHKKQSKEK